MAFADLAALKAALASPQQQLDFTKLGLVARSATRGCTQTSQWSRTGMPGAGATPGAVAVQPTNTSVGALGQLDASAGSLYAAFRRFATQLSSAAAKNDAIAKIILADRLSHVSGFNATLTTPQNTGGMGLTRSTTGEGVFAALEIYTALGATGTTATVSYTNQAGVAGQVSQPIVIGSTDANGVGRFLPISLAAGDTGVRDVASVTLAASTLTAGDFGVTLYRPLLSIPCVDSAAFPLNGDPVRACGGYLPVIPNGAALFLLVTHTMSGNAQSIGLIAEIALMES